MMARIEKPEAPIPLPDATPNALREWLAELPFTNTAYCLAALLRALRTFNASVHLKPSIRFGMADVLEPYVSMLVERTEKPLLSTSMPQLPTVRSAELGAALYREMAVAYSLACPAKRLLGSLWQREELCQASYHSLRHWGQYLLSMAQLYKEPEAGFWPAVYRVYRQAEEFGVISRAVDNQDEPPACKTVRGTFKRILLFALGGGGRFRPRDMRHVFGILGTLADAVSLEQRLPPDREPGRFYFSLDDDRAPITCPDECKVNPADRFFGTGDLVSALLKDPLPVKGNHFGDAHNRHIQTVLAKSLCGGKNRKSSRLQTNHECGLFIGLSDIIDALSSTGGRGGAFHSDMPLDNLSPIDWTKRSRYELVPLESSKHDTFSERIVLDEWNYLNDPPAAAPDPALVPKGQALSGALVNTSPHGYCVLITGAGCVDLQIGVPIGIVEDGGSMFLGTVRWLRREETGVRFGIKLLSPNAEVVDIRLSDGTGKGKGLLLPADRILRHDPELVVPPRVFRVNSELLIEGRNQPPRPYLGQICEQTLSFTRMTLAASRAKPSSSRV
ncbi:hypothetical protein [Methylomagnum sp.]